MSKNIAKTSCKSCPAELAARAFERLALENLAPTPENYSIWYNYYSGRIPDLNEAIDLIVSLGKSFTRSRCEDLYTRFLSFGENAKAIQDAGERAESSIELVLDGLGTAEEENRSFLSSLSAMRGRIEDSVSIGTLRAIIGEIRADLKSVANMHARLQAMLVEASKSFSLMRQQLHIAGLELRIDALTGVSNKKGFDQAIDGATEEHAEAAEPLSLLMIDLDHFKSFNDRNGPIIGDQVLKLMAQMIQRTISAHPERRCSLFQQKGKGKGDAVRLGYEHASGDVLMILDADLTVPPEDLPRFYNALECGQAEFVNGVRLVYPMEKEAMRFANLLGNKFFSLAFSWLLGQPVKDSLCGTKVLWKQDYLRIAANRHVFGDFDPFGDFDLLFGAARLNLKIIDLPIRYRERTYGATNIERWKHGVLLLRMVLFAASKIKFI